MLADAADNVTVNTKFVVPELPSLAAAGAASVNVGTVSSLVIVPVAIPVPAIVAFAGTINPSTGDLGVLVPLEHAMLAHGVPDHERTRTFARYSLIGALSMAGGSLAAAAPDLVELAGIDRLSAFKLMFYAYAVLGLLSVGLYRLLPHARMDEARPSAPLGPSRKVVYKLAALFSLDAFAGGFVVQSLIAYWFYTRFGLGLDALGWIFFGVQILSGLSLLLAARAARFDTPLDGVFANVRDPDGFERDTVLSRRLGYRGRKLIHPSQIEPCNRLYRPSEAELDYYARVLAAFDQAVAQGSASTTVDGRMIDMAMANAARRLARRRIAMAAPSSGADAVSRAELQQASRTSCGPRAKSSARNSRSRIARRLR